MHLHFVIPSEVEWERCRDGEAVLEEMRAEHDQLALHIFLARRQYPNTSDTKSSKRH
jgi:hypothetical protein